MSDYMGSRSRRSNYLDIHPETRKIIFFNAHDPRGIEFYDQRNNYCMELLFTGISVLCLCNPEWRLHVGSRGLRVSLTIYQSDSADYFLRRIRTSDGNNFEYFRIEKFEHQLSSEYACLSQVRAYMRRYPSMYLSGSGNTPYCPLAVRQACSDRIRVLKTLFYTTEDRIATCVNKDPLPLHWVDN